MVTWHRSLRLMGLLMVLSLCSLGKAWALALGDQVSPQAITTEVKQGGSVYKAVEETQGQEHRVALVNDDNRVFILLIRSTGESAPAAQDYLGDYARFPAQLVRVVPLRSRVVRYEQGDRMAEWHVSGLSGQFSARAISLDLAPAELKVEEKNP